MCAEAKTNHVKLVSPDLNTIEYCSCWMSSGNASRIAQCNLGIFDSFMLLSIKNGCGLQRTLCGITCFWLDLVMRQLLLQERVMSVFGRIKLKRTDLDKNEIFIL